MSEIILIGASDFLPYRAIATNIEVAKRLEPHIVEAQKLDLAPLLGAGLYFDLLKYTQSLAAGIAAAAANEPPTTYAPTPEEIKFKNLLSGCTYTVYAGDTKKELIKIYEGLKPVLVYFSYARFVLRDNIRSTPNGFVEKKTLESENISAKQLSEEANRAISAANVYLQTAFTFQKDSLHVTGSADDWKKYTENNCCNENGPVKKRSGFRAVKNSNRLSRNFNRNER